MGGFEEDLLIIFSYRYLILASLFGAVVGFFTQLNKKKNQFYLKDFLLFVALAFFLSFVSFEIAYYFFNSKRLAIAIAVFVGFFGDEAAIYAKERLTALVDKKIDRL